MKRITIKVLEWSDIKAWWKDRTEPKRIRENAKDALDWVDAVWAGKVEDIIDAHYPKLGNGADMDKYTALVNDLKLTLSNFCETAKTFI